LPAHTHAEGEQCVVLHGELSIGEERLSAGEYRYWKPGESQPRQTAEHGCLLLISSPLD
jgi:anti-sigma factor ChrR (cupin superfamily)